MVNEFRDFAFTLGKCMSSVTLWRLGKTLDGRVCTTMEGVSTAQNGGKLRYCVFSGLCIVSSLDTVFSQIRVIGSRVC